MSLHPMPEDLSLAPELIALAAPEAHAFLKFKAEAERDGGAIPPKYRELIALSVALATQCGYCLDAHARNARRAGATREDLAEAVFIAAALRAGAAAAHGLMALRLFEGQPPAGDGPRPSDDVAVAGGAS